MANTTISPNMGLIIPVVGTDPGPDWANNLNASLTTLDGHNHTPGYGVQITPSGLNINADLPLNNNNATLIRTVRFNPQSSTPSNPNDLGCLYESGVDLYYVDGSGNVIRITQSGSVAGATGTITGLPSGTASASFASSTFTFQSATNTPAFLSSGPVAIGNNTVGSPQVTVFPPSAIATNYSIFLPPIPSINSLVSITPSGVMGTTIPSNLNLPGNAVQVNGLNAIVSYANATNNVGILRGQVEATGAVSGGEAFICNHVTTGNYNLTFQNTFTDAVAFLGSCIDGSPTIVTFQSLSTAGVEVLLYAAGGGAVDAAFSFIVVGQV